MIIFYKASFVLFSFIKTVFLINFRYIYSYGFYTLSIKIQQYNGIDVYIEPNDHCLNIFK